MSNSCHRVVRILLTLASINLSQSIAACCLFFPFFCLKCSSVFLLGEQEKEQQIWFAATLLLSSGRWMSGLLGPSDLCSGLFIAHSTSPSGLDLNSTFFHFAALPIEAILWTLIFLSQLFLVFTTTSLYVSIHLSFMLIFKLSCHANLNVCYKFIQTFLTAGKTNCSHVDLSANN